MSLHNHFNYIIIGNGLAGLQLAIELSNDPFFDDKQIALIDKSQKDTNDKTWCFWEKGSGKWDSVVSNTWNSALFYSSKKKIDLNLEPCTYKMVRSIDFYKQTKSILSQKNNIHFIIDDVISVDEKKPLVLTTKKGLYTADHVFDSRINPDFFNKKDNYIRINQHFKGWIIESETDVFNTNSFTMMDYRLKDGEQTTFTYVLPFSKKKALVEFTYFTPHIVEDRVYNKYLKQYISDVLNIETYTVLEVETGNIPMTNFPFSKESSEHITKIGTAGGWVKGSTGYSFKHTEKKVARIIDNLKQNNRPSKGLYNKRHTFYDTVFLKVLKDNNNKGEWVFEQFYSKNAIETMFHFLDEESSFSEELKIMQSLFSVTFIKAFFKTLLL